MKADTPELSNAIAMLRQIYWREYGRGWRDAVENIQRVLKQPALECDLAKNHCERLKLFLERGASH